jgi:hypothetical protein
MSIDEHRNFLGFTYLTWYSHQKFKSGTLSLLDWKVFFLFRISIFLLLLMATLEEVERFIALLEITVLTYVTHKTL